MANPLIEMIKRSKMAKRGPSASPRQIQKQLADQLEEEAVNSALHEQIKRKSLQGGTGDTFQPPKNSKSKTVPLHVGDFDEEAWAMRKLMRDKETAVPLRPDERGALKEIDARNKEFDAAKKPQLAPDEPTMRDELLSDTPESIRALPDLTGKPLEQSLYELLMDYDFGKGKSPGIGHNKPPTDVSTSSFDNLGEQRQLQSELDAWGQRETTKRVETKAENRKKGK